MPRVSPAPETMASKAVNQYRSRDIFGYLALRYCLEAPIARFDDWAYRNAIQVVLGSPRGRYLRSYHFKGIVNGEPEYRELRIPGPSEALAEAVLLSQCAREWERERFENLFSYHPTDVSDRSGYFLPYMYGLRERQNKISECCENNPDAIVTYVDIKKFYPSVTPAVARYAWDSFARRANLPVDLRALGEKLIANHAIETENKSILTGPMFSHFIANLVLKVVDDNAEKYPALYLRYVDDITLVGSETDVRASIDAIAADLGQLGLALHTEDNQKTLTVPVREWVSSASDFRDDQDSTAWMRLVGDIRKLLIFQPDLGPVLETELLLMGFRFPMPDYTLARQDRTVFEKVRRLGLWSWLFKRSRHVSVSQIIETATRIRDQMEEQSLILLHGINSLNAFQQKRRISKLRYRLGRLAYLSSPKTLHHLSDATKGITELTFHSALLRAVATRDCSEIVSLGSNVCQAAGQIFRATGAQAEFSKPIRTEPEHQGLAILMLNGVSVDATLRSLRHPLVKFASEGVDMDLITYPRGFVQEIACLHGLGGPRHADTIKAAFDLDQEIALDALEFDYGYYL